jgi:hypothetical protein
MHLDLCNSFHPQHSDTFCFSHVDCADSLVMEWPLDLDRYFVKECYKLKEHGCCPEASPLVFSGDLKQQMSLVTGLDLEKRTWRKGLKSYKACGESTL